MPVFDSTGQVVPRNLADLRAALLDALTSRFGKGVTNEANTIRLISEAGLALPFVELEQYFTGLFAEMDPRGASIANLRKLLWPLFDQLPASASTGIVNVNYDEIPTTPATLFNAGDVTFVDGAGRTYGLDADVALPTAIHDTSLQTGTASESIDGSTNTHIAQRFTFIADLEFAQLAQVVANHVAGSPVATFRIETDSNGEPSGTLADTKLEKTGVTLANGTATDVIFAEGANLSAGDYWLVMLPTSGTFTLDGGTGGAADQVLFKTGGAWGASSNIENGNVKVIRGGVFEVVADSPGTDGNIAAESVSSQTFSNATASSRWDNIVSTADNLVAFKGGRNLETAAAMRSRARLARAARETGSRDGILKALRDLTEGVEGADVLENTTEDWGTQDTILDNAADTGTSSESIDATNTRISQSFTTTQFQSASAVAVNLATQTGFVFTLTIQGDSAGEPDGTPVSTKFTKTAATPGATGRTVYTFDNTRGDFLEAGTYHVVLERTAGSATLEGSGDGGGDSNVRIFTGTWAQSANIDEAAVEVFGGLPPKSLRAYVKGGTSTGIAQSVYGQKPLGIYSDGTELGTAEDLDGRDVSIRFSRPTEIGVVFSVTVDITSAFGGDADTIKDLLIEYAGGEDSDGDDWSGLNVTEDLIRQEAMSRLLHGDLRTVGVKDITLFRVGRKEGAIATPGDLTSANVNNLTAAQGEQFRIQALGDIDVTLNVV